MFLFKRCNKISPGMHVNKFYFYFFDMSLSFMSLILVTGKACLTYCFKRLSALCNVVKEISRLGIYGNKM